MDPLFKQISNQIKKKELKHLYVLHGEEPFFVQQLEKKFADELLSDDEKEFDQEIFYGKEVDIPQVLASVRQFPMIGKHRLVIVREAQELKDFKPIQGFLDNPSNKSVLVLAFKGKKADQRKIKFLKHEHCVDFYSKKIYDNQLPGWIENFVSNQGYKINAHTAAILAEYLGNDLSKINNELGKLFISLPAGSMITGDVIEQNIGVSKDFNVFELTTAIANKDVKKSNQIINYFAENEKNHPLVLTIAQLYKFFSNLLYLHMNLTSLNSKAIAQLLKINIFFTKDYEIAIKAYSRKKTAQIIHLLAEYDLKSKGVNNATSGDGALLKELLFKILH